MISRNQSQRGGRRGAATLLFFAITMAAGPAQLLRAKEPEPAPDITTQYHSVLAAMKNPDTTGVLITEIGPDSAAGSAGARGGDIITSYAGRNITTLKELRQGVAEVLASRVVEKTDRRLLLGVRRDKDDVVLQIEPAPLGIRAIEVEAGVPAPLNPPPSLRGTISLAWNEISSHTAEQPDYLRTTDQGSAAWLGSIRRTFSFAGETISGEILITHIDPGDDPGTGSLSSTDTVTFHLQIGDYKNSPPFVLDEFTLVTDGDGQKTTTTGQRAGAALRTETSITSTDRNFAPQKAETPFPPDGLLQPLVPLVAAGMAKEKDAVLPLSLTSIRDFVSRPGYILISRGSQKMPDAATAFRVDLMHCGVAVEQYWFNDHRELLRVDLSSSTGVASVHAGSREAAELPLTKKEPPAKK